MTKTIDPPGTAAPRGPDLWAFLKTPTRGAIIVTLLVGVLSAGLSAGLVLSQPAEYQSITSILVDQPNAIVEAVGEGIVLKLNQLRSKYTVLMRTDTILDPVAKKLGLGTGEVSRSFEVVTPGPSLVIAIVARSDTPRKSRDIANGMAEEVAAFVQREQDAAPVRIQPGQRIFLRIVSPASPGLKVEPTRQRAIYVGLIGGALALALMYLVSRSVAWLRLR